MLHAVLPTRGNGKGESRIGRSAAPGAGASRRPRAIDGMGRRPDARYATCSRGRRYRAIGMSMGHRNDGGPLGSRKSARHGRTFLLEAGHTKTPAPSKWMSQGLAGEKGLATSTGVEFTRSVDRCFAPYNGVGLLPLLRPSICCGLPLSSPHWRAPEGAAPVCAALRRAPPVPNGSMTAPVVHPSG